MEENNKLIAEFMRVDQVDIDTWLETNSNLHYHNSWDWLMPVVKKVMQEDYDFLVFEELKYQLSKIDIDAVYSAVVEFVKLYLLTR